MENPRQYHRFGRSIYRQKKWLLAENSVRLRKTTLGKAGGQQENTICQDKCLVFPQVVHL